MTTGYVGPNGQWVSGPDSPNVGARPSITAPPATGDATLDANNLAAIIAAAGANASISFPTGQTYLMGRELVALPGQQLHFNQSILKLPDQIASVLTNAAVIDSTGNANPVVQFQVASALGFYVGQRVTVDDRTVGGQVTFANIPGLVSAVSNGRVTVSFTVGASSPVYATVNTTTNVATSGNSYTAPVGATLCSLSTMLSAPYLTDRVGIYDLEINGNRANNPLGNRWEISPCLDVRGARCNVQRVYCYNAVTDAIYNGAQRSSWSDLQVSTPGAMCIHNGATFTTIGAQTSTLSKLWLDSPGMGTPIIGHTGGIGTGHPAYAAIGFSRNTDHLIFTDVQITNDSGTTGTYGQAIGCITGSDNARLTFNDVKIRDFNKGLGAIQIVIAAAQPSQQIDFNGLHVENSGPTTPATFNMWEGCFIGVSSSGSVNADHVRFQNCDFTDTPLLIYDSTNVSLDGVKFNATTQAGTATLNIVGSNVGVCTVNMNNVTLQRIATTSGNSAQLPGSGNYSRQLYIGGGKVVANDVRVLGGNLAIEQVGGDVTISNLVASDVFQNVMRLAGGATSRSILNSPTYRLNAAFTASNSFIAFDANSSSGASGPSSINEPNIDMVTTNAGQSAIRLCPTAAIPCTVTGGKVKVSGTSTAPILSGGAVGIGIVAGTLLSHTFTPGAAETSSGTVVSTNA